MKKIVFAVLLIIIWPCYSAGETSVLNLRSSHHLDFVRIVIEGEEEIIENAHVYQRGTDVLVKFSTSDFSIKAEKKVIDYRRTDKKMLHFLQESSEALKCSH
jgi:hypothetical protein